jgi:hypothetical protein
MNVRTHVIYIPGLGDGYDGTRRMLLSLWRYRNISVELVQMSWAVEESFEMKRQRVYDAIDSARALNKRVVLIGESAGGSMAVNVYGARRREISRVVTLCGKNTHPETVALKLYQKNPAFRTSMNNVNESIAALDLETRQRFTSIVPLYDPVVPVHETLLADCRKVRVFAFGHLVAILLLISALSSIVVREIRRDNP